MEVAAVTCKTCPWYDGLKAGVPFCVLPACPVREKGGEGGGKNPKAPRRGKGEKK